MVSPQQRQPREESGLTSTWKTSKPFVPQGTSSLTRWDPQQSNLSGYTSE
jgi:hypothetical protein